MISGHFRESSVLSYKTARSSATKILITWYTYTLANMAKFNPNALPISTTNIYYAELVYFRGECPFGHNTDAVQLRNMTTAALGTEISCVLQVDSFRLCTYSDQECVGV